MPPNQNQQLPNQNQPGALPPIDPTGGFMTPPQQPAKQPSKLKWVIIGAVAFVVILLLISLLATKGTNKTETTDTSNDAQASQDTVKDEASGFSITPPDGWTQDEEPAPGASISFSKPRSDDSIATTSIALSSTVVNNQKLSAFANKNTDTLKNEFSEYSQASREDIKIGKDSAIIVNGSFRLASTQYNVMQLNVVKGKIGYTITALGDSTTWQQDQAAIKTALLSARF